MHRRRLSRLPVLAAALVVAVPVTAQAGGSEEPPIVCASTAGVSCTGPDQCAKSGTKTVRKNGLARLYSQGKDPNKQLRGCLQSRGIGKSLLLAENYDDGIYESGTWDQVRLWDRFAAWRYTRVDESCKANCPPDYEPITRTFRVRDLKSGKSRLRPASFKLGPSFVLSRSRVIATAVRTGDDQAEVRSWDGEKDKLVAKGDIDVKSLYIQGNEITWLQNGKERSASL